MQYCRFGFECEILLIKKCDVKSKCQWKESQVKEYTMNNIAWHSLSRCELHAWVVATKVHSWCEHSSTCSSLEGSVISMAANFPSSFRDRSSCSTPCIPCQFMNCLPPLTSTHLYRLIMVCKLYLCPLCLVVPSPYYYCRQSCSLSSCKEREVQDMGYKHVRAPNGSLLFTLLLVQVPYLCISLLSIPINKIGLICTLAGNLTNWALQQSSGSTIEFSKTDQRTFSEEHIYTQYIPHILLISYVHRTNNNYKSPKNIRGCL